MTTKMIFIALYRALDCLYEETKREDLGNYLSEANPYLFTDRISADPAVYADFCDFVDKQYHKATFSEEESYVLVKSYLSSSVLSYYGDFSFLFDDISIEEWMDLCKMIESELQP